MPVFNQSRSRVIQFIFAGVFIAITGQLINLQLFSSKYKLAADNNAFYRKVIYPDRGIVFDRKKRGILENTISYDLVVIPSEARGTDTATLCRLLNIDTAVYKKRMRDLIFKNTSVKPSVFEALLTPEMFAKLNENMYRFPGFSLNERSVRTYPYNVGAAILGYMAEVDTGFLRRHRDDGYEMGDYFGSTGLESTYEKVLMGQRGIKRFIRDNKGRLQGSWENGAYDTAAVAGNNLYSSIDVELQQLGEKLMENKVGSIVAIDPKTGGILCMVSAPTYNPNYLTGNQRKKHLVEMLYFDPRLPLLNRTLGTFYSPGSTFKTMVGIIGMNEGVIDDQFTVSCGGAYYGCGRPMGCHAKGTFTLKPAISKSCNSYFAATYRRILENPKYPNRDSALNSFNQYAYSFGLGRRLGVDLPSEKMGNIPTPKYYHGIFGKNWQSCNIISNSIGQGEIATSLTQLANVMAIIANKGWYYTPHLIDSIEGGDQFGLLDKFRVKHKTKEIPEYIWEEVHEGMQGTMEFGTGFYAKVPGINVCGKTGTVENAYRGEKLKDHAFFGAFAPRENPRIAIAVMCENAGYGATSAAPIASLLIEKYLKDSVSGNDRKAKIEQLANMNLIPPQMKRQMVKRDSLRQAQQLAAAKKAARDTSGVEEAPEETDTDSSVTPNKPQPAKKGTKKDTANKVALLPEEQRKNNTKRKTAA
ncbi:penicillin-binding transpeptidase domain-containing protein [Sediminibacterium sp.]|uniref:peptidoglycan D,D-transpeptidase FtsI family protein n=1 Tax=Sediminibacterium sp. TaxID=1917865 RepID=UPI0025E005EE|nr:penicillin-binding transpeptidase domain-containing protein [Sediminibacterium sp.]MBW0177142.1 penicillin-binding protein 2 [Sediminibacterium sp.]